MVEQAASAGLVRWSMGSAETWKRFACLQKCRARAEEVGFEKSWRKRGCRKSEAEFVRSEEAVELRNVEEVEVEIRNQARRTDRPFPLCLLAGLEGVCLELFASQRSNQYRSRQR